MTEPKKPPTLADFLKAMQEGTEKLAKAAHVPPSLLEPPPKPGLLQFFESLQDSLNAAARVEEGLIQKVRTANDFTRDVFGKIPVVPVIQIAFADYRSDGRPTKDALYSALAKVLAEGSDCSRPRGKVGALVVRDDMILGWGYVGVAPGEAGCLSGACPRAEAASPSDSPYTDCISTHAEMNAIANCSVHPRDATIYINREPCYMCRKVIAAARIERIVVDES